jgi:hypothetical protein
MDSISAILAAVVWFCKNPPADRIGLYLRKSRRRGVEAVWRPDDGSDPDVSLPEGACGETPRPSVSDDTPAPQPRYGACPTDIVRVLEAAGRPLTTQEVLDALAGRNLHHGESTVKRWLACLVKSGAIENPDGGDPPGYRLPATR